MLELNCSIVKDYYINKAKEEIDKLDTKPSLLIVQVGDRQDSNKYVRNKIRSCEDVGINVKLLKLEYDITEECLINYILSMQNTYHGVIVQCPLPPHINEKNVMKSINPIKDVDGLTEANIGALHNGNPNIIPATAQGIINMLDFYDVDVKGMNVLLIGRSLLVNRPLQEVLCQRNATVTLAHSITKDLDKMLSSGNYDMVVSAIGKAKYLKNIKSQYIIDVGINLDGNGKMCGDVDIDTCKCDYFTPVPKGVGLLTVSSVITNVLKCYNASKY